MINLDCESLYENCPPEEADIGAYKRAFCPQIGPIRIPIPKPETDHIDAIRQILEEKMKLEEEQEQKKKKKKTTTSDSLTEQGLPISMETWRDNWIRGNYKNVITVIGPGIYSQPPAETPTGSSISINCKANFGTVLTERCEDLVKKYRLKSRSSLFELDQLVHKPKAFYELARDIFPGLFKPTIFHYFIKLLADQNRLSRHYSLNIDMMERLVDVPEELLVETYGTFNTSHCIDCHLEHSICDFEEQLFSDQLPRCLRCRSLLRPDLVFVGEMLHPRFYLLPEKDFAECDLLLVMGTQVKDTPIAELFDRVRDTCLRVVMVEKGVKNKHIAKQIKGWQEGEINMRRDVLWEATQSDQDESVWELARHLELLEDLETLILNATKSTMSIERSAECVPNNDASSSSNDISAGAISTNSHTKFVCYENFISNISK